MESDSHPLLGWARLLRWKRSAGGLGHAEEQLLNEAFNKAALVYDFWRPELRYKPIEVAEKQLADVRKAVIWFKQNQDRL